jgi:hypothetical protein
LETLRWVFGFALIIFGLSYPLLTLWQLNRQMNSGGLPARPQLIFVLTLSAVWPLTAVLAGFWLINAHARGSLAYNGALGASIVLLLITLIAGWWINRPG